MQKSLPTKPFGTLIDWSEKINFKFENQNYVGYKGDTIASALLRNDEKIISRSFKYHRARGVFSMSGQDANTLVQLSKEGNVIADTYPIDNGLQVTGQHYYGTLKKDKFRIFQLFSKFLPVGFYYRAFYKNDGWNKRWGSFFRKFTGLGVINTYNSESYYDKKYLFYDVVVVGSGVSGLESALATAKGGAHVLLIEQMPILGGALNYERSDIKGELSKKLLLKLTKAVELENGITVMLDSICNANYSDNWLAVVQRNRLHKLRAKQLLLCTGSFEQPIVFRNNDLPGIMLSSAALRLTNLYGVKPGDNAVIATTTDQGYLNTLELVDAGVNIQAVLDLRKNAFPEHLIRELEERSIKIYKSHTVNSASKNSHGCLKSVEIAEIINDGNCSTDTITIDCDLLCLSGGYMPSYQLPCHVGARLEYNETTNLFNIINLPKDCYILGSTNNLDEIEDIKKDVKNTVNIALHSLGFLKTIPKTVIINQKINEYVLPVFEHDQGKEFIDLDEDLQIADIVNAVREGYEDIQLVKRFSTLGMGPSQGRFSAYPSSLLIAHREDDKTINQVGVTTARPPFSPEKIGHMAGRNFFPERHSSMHNKHLELGAQPLIAGAWIRPAFYGDKDSLVESMKNESLNVRNNVGVVDVSTLGGLEVRGTDAAEFVNRMYTGNFINQPVGKARYSLLTNEAGVVIDDGVVCRFSDQHFYLTATTGGVDNVYLQFLKWNAQWRLDVDIANVTSAWCGINIAGPNSRKVLEKICTDVDLSTESFPYMSVKEGHVADIAARLIRVGFVGELGYELHVLQHHGEALLNAVLKAGEEFDIKPFGIETQRLLRLEKGHVIISQDTDSTTYPAEISMSWTVKNDKAFFVGQKSIEIVNKKQPLRKLVGFELPVNKLQIKENHLCFDENEKLIGRITSTSYSFKLDKVIGMAFIDDGHTDVDTVFQIRCDEKYLSTKVVKMPFYDPDNARQKL